MAKVIRERFLVNFFLASAVGGGLLAGDGILGKRVGGIMAGVIFGEMTIIKGGKPSLLVTVLILGLQ